MTLEQRVTQLEKEIADLKRQLEERPEVSKQFILETVRDSLKKNISRFKFYVEDFKW